jgi:hypothetical protein
MTRPRIRTIKPEFFKHEGLFDLERETGLPIRIAFSGLWTCCDREGRFEWRPRWLKSEIIPYDDVDFSRVLDALATRGFLVKYAIGAQTYGYIPSWKKHQVINNRELDSLIPAPPEEVQIQEADTSLTRDARVVDGPSTRTSRVTDACPNSLNVPQAEGEGEWKGNGTEGEAGSPHAPAPEQSSVSQPEKVPADLHPVQYASRLLQELGMPETRSNSTVVGASISALIREGRSSASAYEFLLAKAKDARDEGVELDKFWFEDAKWRSNGRNNGKHNPNRAERRQADNLAAREAARASIMAG